LVSGLRELANHTGFVRTFDKIFVIKTGMDKYLTEKRDEIGVVQILTKHWN
jgi:hypothetical protein